ncbi:hypothetical protein VNPA110517_14240 [Pseudomonas aeruginosa]|nr:hypothetical protein VNPA110517_14240 [Pseudomonas aeruginosa]
MSSAAPAGRTNPALASLTAPVRALLTVAGDELRKDGGNKANRVPRADRTEQPKGWASESRNPVCGVNSKPFFLCQEKCHATRIPLRFPFPGAAFGTPLVR